MTDEELDALVSDLRRTQWGQPLPNQAAAAIMAIRAQLADANARADRAEAERAAQPSPDVAALVDEAEKLRNEFSSYKFNSLGDFYDPGKDPQFSAFDAVLARVKGGVA